MSSNVNCSYCQASVNVTEVPADRPLVCPHCLSNIANLRLAPAGEAPNVLRDIRREPPWITGLVALRLWRFISAGFETCFENRLVGAIVLILLLGLAVLVWLSSIRVY